MVLAEKTVPQVLKQLRKLPWAEHERYVIKCLLKVYRAGPYTRPLLGSTWAVYVTELSLRILPKWLR